MSLCVALCVFWQNEIVVKIYGRIPFRDLVQHIHTPHTEHIRQVEALRFEWCERHSIGFVLSTTTSWICVSYPLLLPSSPLFAFGLMMCRLVEELNLIPHPWVCISCTTRSCHAIHLPASIDMYCVPDCHPLTWLLPALSCCTESSAIASFVLYGMKWWQWTTATTK